MMLKLLLCVFTLWADSWDQHKEQIHLIEKEMYKLEKELDVLVKRKNRSQDQVRVKETLDRIIDIHTHLIGLREKMDNQRKHLNEQHPDKAHVLQHYDARLMKERGGNKNYTRSELSDQLDALLIQVKMKYASFFDEENSKKALEEIDKIVEDKKKTKRNRESETYLRERSDIKISK